MCDFCRQTSDTESCEILHENRNQMHVLAMLEMHTAKELNGSHAHHGQHHHQQPQRTHRQRPRSKELQYSHESLDGLDGAVQSQSQQRHQRYHHHHHHQQRQQQQQRYNHVQEQEERDDTEDNLADEEFEDDEVGRDVRQKRLQKSELNHKRSEVATEAGNHHDDEVEEEDDDDDEEEDHRNGGREAAPLTNGSMRGLEANVINDELKYGATHLNHQSMDSNPLESQSEWSDDDCREEATGENLALYHFL